MAIDGCIHDGWLLIRNSKCNYNLTFLCVLLGTENMLCQYKAMAAGSTVNNLNKELVASTKVSFPEVDEQQKIGSFFSNIDSLISLEQKKYDKLTQVKKSMLEKMFPKEGATVPEIRFAGFTGDWEQKRIGDIADIIGGGTPSTSISEYWDGDIDWYAPAEINNQTYVECSVRKITKMGLDNCSARILPANRTILFTSRAGIGKTAILRHPGATNQGFQSLVLKDDVNPYFIFSMSSFIKEKAERIASGSTFAEISGKMLADIEILVPKNLEQHKIGSYFSHLDSLISLQQRKLEKLKNIKKSLLEKMFV